MARKKTNAAEELASIKGQQNLEKTICSSSQSSSDIFDRNALEQRKLRQKSNLQKKKKLLFNRQEKNSGGKKRFLQKNFGFKSIRVSIMLVLMFGAIISGLALTKARVRLKR